jgi:hypothetical protein
VRSNASDEKDQGKTTRASQPANQLARRGQIRTQERKTEELKCNILLFLSTQ